MRGLIICPVVNNLTLTLPAIDDSLQQLGGAAEVLVINQGSASDVRAALEEKARTRPRLHVVTHDPPLPALAATWNQALDFAWATGHEDALVVNNDIRMGAWIYEQLRGLSQALGLWFATPVNVRDQADPEAWQRPPVLSEVLDLGGPDFSCFLITRACHEQYRFDERYQPGYFEDGAMHRTMWLGGDGPRIAGLPIPYLHYGSATVTNASDTFKASWAAKFDRVRQQYVACWGGLPHQERRITPDSVEDFEGVGTPGGWLGGKYPTVKDGQLVWREASDADRTSDPD